MLVQRGRLGSPAVDRAKRVDRSRRRNSRARPSRTKRSPGTRRSAYAASSVPTATPLSMTRTVSSELIVPTLFQNQRATRRLRRPNRPVSAPEPRRSPARACSGFRLDCASRRVKLAGQEIQAGVEISPSQLGHRPGVANQVESGVRVLVAGARHADQLLAEHVEWCADHPERLDPSGAGSLSRDRRTGQLGRSCRQQQPARDGAAAMARATHSLQATRHAAWRANLNRQISGADIDAELETRAGDDRPDLSLAKSRFDRPPSLSRPGPSGVRRQSVRARRASVGSCRRSCVSFSAKARVLAKMTVVRLPMIDRPQTFQADGDSSSRGAVLRRLDQALNGDLDRRCARRRRCRDNAASSAIGQPEIELTLSLGQQVADRPMRIGSHWRVRCQPLERNSQVGASFRGRECVDLVDDDVVDAAPERPPAFLAQEQRETLGRGDQNVRRMIAQAAPLMRPTCHLFARPPAPGMSSRPSSPADSVQRPVAGFVRCRN